MRGKRALIAAVAAAGVGVAAWKLLSTGVRNPANARAARAVAAGLEGALEAATQLEEPYRCARLGGVAERLGLADGPLVMGVVADARGVTDHLAAVRRHFARRKVKLVVSLGGMGRTDSEITAALDALAGDWPLLAIPGDRESLPAHRRACAALAANGVIDGAATRLVQAGDITLATLPGGPHQARLSAGTDGCAFTAEDSAALVRALVRSGDKRPRVLLSHTPPRQRGREASDIGAGGVHLGDIALADAVATAGVDLVVHGLVAPIRGQNRGETALGSGSVEVLSAGAADGLPDLTQAGRTPSLALIVSIDEKHITWEQVTK